MARRKRKSALGPILVLGGLTAAGIMIYQNRDKISAFVQELTGAVPAVEPDLEVEFQLDETPAVQEADIVIDRSGEEPEEPEAPAQGA